MHSEEGYTQQEVQYIKVGERRTKSGLIIEDYCPKSGGLTLEEGMEKVLKIAADYWIAKLS
jgi:hypothetical protein